MIRLALALAAVLSILLAPARAAEPEAQPTPAPGITIPMPAFGVSVVFDGQCVPRVAAGSGSFKKTGQFALDVAKAQRICLEAKAIADEQLVRAEAERIRAGNETQLVGGLTIAAMNGGSTSYSATADGDVHMASGAAAEWREYGTAIASERGAPFTGVVDQRFVQAWTLDQARAGFMAAPAVPGGVVRGPVADAGALETCKQALTATAGQLEQCNNRR